MQVCNYCGRMLKKEYDKCPGCGSDSFKKMNRTGQIVIDTPPAGGYHIDASYLEVNLKKYETYKTVGIIFLIITVICEIAVFGYSLGEEEFWWSFVFSSLLVLMLPFTIGITLLSVGVGEQTRSRKKYNRLIKLKTTGILVKNMKYELQQTSTIDFYQLKVFYENKEGKITPIISDLKHLENVDHLSQTVDMLYDPDDFSNRYFDFEIY